MRQRGTGISFERFLKGRNRRFVITCAEALLAFDEIRVALLVNRYRSLGRTAKAEQQQESGGD